MEALLPSSIKKTEKKELKDYQLADLEEKRREDGEEDEEEEQRKEELSDEEEISLPNVWLDPWSFLDIDSSLKSLVSSPSIRCPKCKKDRWVYCSKCFKLLSSKLQKTQVKLPFELIVVFDNHLRKNNRTATHAFAICPDQVDFQTVPNLFLPESNVAVLYPSAEAKEIESMTPEELKQYKKLILIESTWDGSVQIFKKHPKLMTLPHIKFSQSKTMYWRNNGRGAHCLSTIETIYYLAKVYGKVVFDQPENEYDKLLILFCLELEKIQNFYKTQNLISPYDCRN